MSLWDLLKPDSDYKTIYITIPRPVYYAAETYALMREEDVEQILNEAIYEYLHKNLYIKYRKEMDNGFKEVNKHLYVRQLRENNSPK